MRRRAKRWSAVDEVLGTVLKRVAAPRTLAGYRVWTFWDDEVGELIAHNAQPVHFRDGVLVVTVANHGWVQDLQFMKEDIRNRLNARLGEAVIRDIQLECGNVVLPAPSEPAPRRLTAQARTIDVPVINDDTVRDAFTRLLEARARRLETSRKPAT